MEPSAASFPHLPEGITWPTISLVTPSYNQGQYLEATIHSVLDQGYPNLEYVVMDGGSSDGSRAIIERYAPRLAYWVSQRDEGQYSAIQEGFTHTGGEVMAWINSDDMLLPWAFSLVGEIFARFPEVAWISSLRPVTWDRFGRAVACLPWKGYSSRAFFHGEYIRRRHGPFSHEPSRYIQQESTFWRRSLWDKVGGLDLSLSLAADFDLWARFYHETELVGVEVPLAGFRDHDDQKSDHHEAEYRQQAEQSLARHGGRPYSGLESALRSAAVAVLTARVRKRLGLALPVTSLRFHTRLGWRLLAETI